MKKVDENGKIIVFEAWLGFAWIDREFMPLPLEKRGKSQPLRLRLRSIVLIVFT